MFDDHEEEPGMSSSGAIPDSEALTGNASMFDDDDGDESPVTPEEAGHSIPDVSGESSRQTHSKVGIGLRAALPPPPLPLAAGSSSKAGGASNYNSLSLSSVAQSKHLPTATMAMHSLLPPPPPPPPPLPVHHNSGLVSSILASLPGQAAASQPQLLGLARFPQPSTAAAVPEDIPLEIMSDDEGINAQASANNATTSAAPPLSEALAGAIEEPFEALPVTCEDAKDVASDEEVIDSAPASPSKAERLEEAEDILGILESLLPPPDEAVEV